MKQPTVTHLQAVVFGMGVWFADAINPGQINDCLFAVDAVGDGKYLSQIPPVVILLAPG